MIFITYKIRIELNEKFCVIPGTNWFFEVTHFSEKIALVGFRLKDFWFTKDFLSLKRDFHEVSNILDRFGF